MPRRPATFRQADLHRALRAAKAAGFAIDRVAIDPGSGKIVIVAKGGDAAKPGTAPDTWLANNARAS